jgi:hypothetical protein
LVSCGPSPRAALHRRIASNVGKSRWRWCRSACCGTDWSGVTRAISRGPTATVSRSGNPYESPRSGGVSGGIPETSGPRLEVFKQRLNVMSSASICTNYAPYAHDRHMTGPVRGPGKIIPGAGRAARIPRRQRLAAPSPPPPDGTWRTAAGSPATARSEGSKQIPHRACASGAAPPGPGRTSSSRAGAAPSLRTWPTPIQRAARPAGYGNQDKSWPRTGDCPR